MAGVVLGYVGMVLESAIRSLVVIPWVHKQTLLCAWKHTFGGLLEAVSCAVMGVVLCLCPYGIHGSRLLM